MQRAHDLPAELHGPAAVEVDLLDPSAHARPRLEHGHVGAARREVPRRGEPGQPGAEDEDVAPCHAARYLDGR